MIIKLYRFHWYKNIKLCLNIKNFGMKIEKKNTKNINNFFNTTYSHTNIVSSNDKKIFNLLVNLCMRKGNKKLALKMMKNTFSLIRRFFWIDPFFFIRIILINSEAVFTLQRYFIGKREKIIPRFINEKKKIKYVLRMLIKYARQLQKEYRFFHVSLAHAIMEYSKSNNVLNSINKEENELSETNKFFLFKKNKKKKKIRLFRQINHWK